MKKWMLAVSMTALLAASAFGQSKESVLALMDKASAKFKSVQTDFEWDQYQAVVNEHDIQRGVMYFKRAGSNVDVAADIDGLLPDRHKKLVFLGGDLKIYSFKTGQTTSQDTSKNREEIESFLALGFGGSSRDLVKNFEISYAGMEPVSGKATYKLELTPTSNRVKSMFNHITLWIDPQTGMSMQQKALEGLTDYRLAKYTKILINQRLPENAFKLKAK